LVKSLKFQMSSYFFLNIPELRLSPVLFVFLRLAYYYFLSTETFWRHPTLNTTPFHVFQIFEYPVREHSLNQKQLLIYWAFEVIEN
jgi:hypothetical protein